ncbi:MAG: ABC transporter permease, partial [Gammaproteobacteria bacterium]
MNALRRIHAVMLKELRQLRRDRLTFGMIIGIPVMQLLLFGYAINMDPRNLAAGVADLSASSASRQFVLDLAHSQVIELRHEAGSAAELEDLLRRGEISVGI